MKSTYIQNLNKQKLKNNEIGTIDSLELTSTFVNVVFRV